MATEWTIGDGDLVIRFDGAPDEFDLEWFVVLETLRRRQWEDAARVVIVRGLEIDPRPYLPRAGTEEIRLSVRAGMTSKSPEVKPLIERWRDLLPKEAAVQSAVAYPAVSLDAIGFSSLSGRFLKEVERVVKLRRERQYLLTCNPKPGFIFWLQRLFRTMPTQNPFGPSLVEEVVQILYPNYPHVLVQP